MAEGDDYDYDAWQRAGSPRDPATGHMPDTYKLPNHPTFSDESIYHGRDGNEGGHWTESDDREAGPGKAWTFTPGRTNLEHHPVEELQDYFNRVEPGNHLALPPSNEGEGDNRWKMSPRQLREENIGRALRGDPERFMGTDILSQPAQTDTLKFIMEHLRINPEKWDQFLAAQTPSTHVEDRRNEAFLGIPRWINPKYGAEKLEEWLQK